MRHDDGPVSDSGTQPAPSRHDSTGTSRASRRRGDHPRRVREGAPNSSAPEPASPTAGPARVGSADANARRTSRAGARPHARNPRGTEPCDREVAVVAPIRPRAEPAPTAGRGRLRRHGASAAGRAHATPRRARARGIARGKRRDPGPFHDSRAPTRCARATRAHRARAARKLRPIAAGSTSGQRASTARHGCVLVASIQG